MNEPTIALTIASFLLLLIFVAMFIWGLKTDQFRDIEEPKYRMFESDNTKDEGVEVNKDA